MKASGSRWRTRLCRRARAHGRPRPWPFKDYGNNVALYPKFQAFFRARRPPTLIVWGKNDVIFPREGARPYLRDLPDAELHLLDTGHFALEDKGDEIAAPMLEFLRRKL
jgi:pimeloyl-ACP methyl ester carboxylesterase